MTLNELMQATDTTARAIKLWEARGLLGPVERENERRRVYADEQVDRVRFIAAAQLAGWSLERIKADMLDYCKLRRSLGNRIEALRAVLAWAGDTEQVERARWIGNQRKATPYREMVNREYDL